ncbi:MULTISPECIES: GatB/YqeY domain-containing protein [Flavobacteriaceae]|uniref:GatB/YqeY domain-containing protein n=2 Tax=Flavobacteriaceae TaxID=49546 RepID=A0A4Y8AT01_9FLAO|nr:MULTISPECIES: GatB/YqeY domain-containing protein [Flavobacteriaceae]TEW75021.1 GatB/YqeY domain-containing protein [Gramella jeungdoensis]GGK42208.1 aspartyl-tRNA amidotransferase subunit B [Lutibacter litoralis]
MSLQQNLMVKIKEAMKSKDKVALESLRAIKSEILLAQTKTGATEELTEDEEIKLLQRLVKQRKDSAVLYKEQGRADLADPELAQVAIISQFLPEQLDQVALNKIIADIIAKVGATSMKDMGKVMGMASKQLAGKADGKAISIAVKQLLE